MIKKKTPLLFLIVSLASCSNKETKKDLAWSSRIRVIDSCEYIENAAEGSNNYSLTHKGNCKFCKERNGH